MAETYDAAVAGRRFGVPPKRRLAIVVVSLLGVTFGMVAVWLGAEGILRLARVGPPPVPGTPGAEVVAGAMMASPAAAATFVYVGNADSNEIYVLRLDRQSGDLTMEEKVPIPGITKPGGARRRWRSAPIAGSSTSVGAASP